MARASEELKTKLRNEYISLTNSARNIEKHLDNSDFIAIISQEELEMLNKKKNALENLIDVVVEQCIYYKILPEDDNNTVI